MCYARLRRLNGLPSVFDRRRIGRRRRECASLQTWTRDCPAARFAAEPSVGALARLKQHLPYLKGTSHRIGTFVVENPWEARGLSINDLADQGRGVGE